mgnify:FL=1
MRKTLVQLVRDRRATVRLNWAFFAMLTLGCIMTSWVMNVANLPKGMLAQAIIFAVGTGTFLTFFAKYGSKIAKQL